MPSQHYVPRCRGDPGSNSDPSIPEEYRDDMDPGYRIREMLESDLLEMLQQKYMSAIADPANQAAVAGAVGQPEEASEGLPHFGGGDDELMAAGGGSLGDAVCGQESDTMLLSATAPGAADGAEAGARPGSSGSPAFGGEASEEEPLATPSRFSGFMRSAGEKVLGALGLGSPPSASDDSPTKGAALDGGEAGDELQPGLETLPTFGSTAPASEAATSAALQQVVQLQPLTTFTYVQPSLSPEEQALGLPHSLAAQRKAQRRAERPALRYAESGDPFYPVEIDDVVFDSFFLRVVHERDRTGFEDAKDFPITPNSIIAARYQVLQYLGSAAFSRAVQCLDLHTNRMVCMKIIKNDKDYIDQSLDEIKLLRLINVNCENVDDKHCLALIDYFYHKEHLIIVTELLRDNLYEFSKINREAGEEPYFTVGRLQRITKQILVALEYIHSLWLMHADLKPENILIKSYSRCEIKVIDFGSSCFVDDQLTSYIQSRSYRAPEVMLGLPYDQKIDIWSLGCIVAELWTGYVLFQNDSVQSLLARIVGIIGPFPAHMMATGRYVPQYFTQDGQLFREMEPYPGPHGTQERRLTLLLPKQSSLQQRLRTDDRDFVDFIAFLLQVDPAKRPTATEALQHPWLRPGKYSDGLQ